MTINRPRERNSINSELMADLTLFLDQVEKTSVRFVVALKEGLSLSSAEIIDYLKERLAKYEIPKSVVFVDSLPRNAAGKVL